MRWAIGAIAAVLSTMVILPGVVSAHHLEYDVTIVCNDGTFDAKISYSGGDNENIIITVTVEGETFTGNAVTGGVNTQMNPGVVNAPANWSAPGAANNQFTFSAPRQRFEIDSHGSPPDGDNTDRFDDFMSVNGTYDDVVAAGGSVDIEASMYNAGGGNDAFLDDPLNVGPLPGTLQRDATPAYIDGHGNPVANEPGQTLTRSVSLGDFEKCRTTTCTDGENVDELEFLAEQTNDCDPVRVCIDGENDVVTEYEQKQGDLQEGDCVTIDLPPPPNVPPTPPTVTTPPAPVQQVAAAVSEVLPARLPSAGMGPSESSSSFSLVAALAVGLLSIGGVATLIARRSRS